MRADDRLQDPPGHTQLLPCFSSLAQRTADAPIKIPETLPARSPQSPQYRFSDTSIYPHLETNIHVSSMSFSLEPMPEARTAWSISQHGADTPFRHWSVVQAYISGLLSRNNYDSFVTYNTTVERVHKAPKSEAWTLTLRKPLEDFKEDYWWNEDFDAVVVASGHYNVPYVPHIPGLDAFAAAHPGVVMHSKAFRDPSAYKDKRVIIVGASVSGGDLSSALASTVAAPLYSVVRGKYHHLFSDWPFQHPRIVRKMGISHFVPDGSGTVVFADGTSVSKPDAVIFATGYSWNLPFVPEIEVRNNRVPHLYQHIFHIPDPTLCFVGAVAAGFTFKIFEWQAVAAARFLAGRAELPARNEMEKWERDRMEEKGDGVPFTIIAPDFEEYFDGIKQWAGEPFRAEDGTMVGRSLPHFEKAWWDEFDDGVQRRIEMFQRINADTVGSDASESIQTID
ncbi:MAG: hypothetical protein M1818_000996 [Claussenomyces sp. TS43310]|nr:MAG: hypothetical protein M1818_000996 [Claussenomyces sp. TS43310]